MKRCIKIRIFFRHLAIIMCGVAVIIGCPFVFTDFFAQLISGDGADTVTSASVILDKPSGEYVVLINKDIHSDESKLNDWITFFSGGEITYIFEDIACSVPNGDIGALSMAESYQSRLPENQMRIDKEESTLLLSRADAGKFDIIVMSKEFAEANKAESAYAEQVAIINVK